MIKSKPVAQNVIVHTVADDGSITSENIVANGEALSPGKKMKANPEHQNLTPEQLRDLVAAAAKRKGGAKALIQ